jgi:uncharacterized protein HemX
MLKLFFSSNLSVRTAIAGLVLSLGGFASMPAQAQTQPQPQSQPQTTTPAAPQTQLRINSQPLRPGSPQRPNNAIDPLEDVRRTSDQDTGSFNSGSSSLNSLFDLFHRANIGSPNANFGQQQQQNLSQEAESFREKQRQLLQQQQQRSTGNLSSPQVAPR